MQTEARYQGMATRATEWGTERAVLLGDPGARLFAVIHSPRTDPKGSVLVCPSLFTDTVLNYRREVHLARLLASFGFTVGRFHYRGTGHSEGDPLAVTVSTMLADALAMARQLTQGDHRTITGFVGTRWGAIVAAGTASRFPGSPIAVWEPVLEGHAFFSEALQASGVAHLTSGNRGPSPKRSFESTGIANILGFPMGVALYDSSRQVSFVEQLGVGSGKVLYLAPQKNGTFSSGHGKALEELQAKKLDVTADALSGLASWWFVDDVSQTPLDAAEATARWFAALERP